MQAPLWNEASFQRPRRMLVIDDYGPIGRGVSQAHYVRAENGNEYLIKGPALFPAHHYVAANELIAAGLGQLLGLPILDYQVLDMGGKLYFGSSYMQMPSFYDHVDEDLFNRCQNRGRVYDLVAFDAWVCNKDRHAGNLLVRRSQSRRDGQESLTLLLNDHSHCLVLPGQTPSHLTTLIGTPPTNYIRLHFVRDAIVSTQLLSAALDAVDALSDDRIVGVVRAVPEDFLPPQDIASIEAFLLSRKSELRRVFRDSGCNGFPRLQGGSL